MPRVATGSKASSLRRRRITRRTAWPEVGIAWREVLDSPEMARLEQSLNRASVPFPRNRSTADRVRETRHYPRIREVKFGSW
jgi:hypothetical protein